MDTNPKLFDVYRETCPTREVLGLIADKWTSLVLGYSKTGRNEFFGALAAVHRRNITKMLTQTLRQLERNGLVTRIVYPEVPPHVEYSLTELGLKLEGVDCANP